ncbi:actin-binding Rho-activating protein [Oncorhynchus mykiss]|nr:actin-binding Rho-activating protein [Oncorhynchus mykiss]XP_021411912.2 actin-binding Rho-activating protein [Oncorhynchus mykiss]XP_021411920.2 actin-binding Rho-activating protein [Oncorhynchus mykiss]
MENNDDRTVCVTSVKGLKDNWQRWSNEHQEYQKDNPFSNDRGAMVSATAQQQRLQRDQDGYGRPQEGSLTEQRGQDAHIHISREVEELCQVIRDIGESCGDGGSEERPVVTVEFGKLFEHYVNISNKVVGILLRARKQGLVSFEGEMLWQGQDDRVLITLLQSPG